MLNAFGNRLSRVEGLLARKLESPKICNCRIDTSYHSAECLKTIFEGASRECPTHGFRDFGFFIYCAKWCTLQDQDDQFCPCAADSWRSFVLNGPLTQEAAESVKRGEYAQQVSKPYQNSAPSSFEQEKEQVDLVIAQYEESKEEFVKATGRQLPDRDAILTVHGKLARKRRKL